jgi:thermitase
MSWLRMFLVALVAFWPAAHAISATAPAATTNMLEWRVEQDKVTADIKGWDVRTLLEHVASATGWQVFLEPGTRYTVSAKFKDRSPGEALRLLVPPLTAVLLPQSNAPPRLLVYRTSAQEATQRIGVAKRKPKHIENELIVKLKPGEKIDDIAKRLGAKVVGRIDGLNAYRLRFDSADRAEAARESLSTDSSVESVENNYPVFRPPDPEPLSLSSAAPMNLRPTAAVTGDQIIVGLIDSGVQKLGNSLDEFLLPGITVAEGGSAEAGGKPKHGDSMFQTILKGVEIAQQSGTESKVRILPVDVYGGSEMTTTFDISAGIYRAVESGAKVINLSLGSPVDTPFLGMVIENSSKQGVLFLGAAGNEPVSTPIYPAAYPDVLAVTAITRSGEIAPWANYGSFVDIGAPGSSVVNFGNQAYLVTGTSTSTALAAGVAAATAQRTGLSGNSLSPLVMQSLAIPSRK